MCDVEVAWLAGLLEGEGAFIRQHVVDGPGRQARLRVKVALHMTDEDVVKKVAALVGMGRVLFRSKQRDHHKDTWYWQISSMGPTVQLMEMLLPSMGKRRQEQITECLAAVAAAGGVRDRRKHVDVV